MLPCLSYIDVFRSVFIELTETEPSQIETLKIFIINLLNKIDIIYLDHPLNESVSTYSTTHNLHERIQT